VWGQKRRRYSISSKKREKVSQKVHNGERTFRERFGKPEGGERKKTNGT